MRKQAQTEKVSQEKVAGSDCCFCKKLQITGAHFQPLS